jgi:TctA family transporter
LISIIFISIIAIPASNLIFYFGPAEYASLMFLGLITVISLGNDSLIKGFSMMLIGLLLCTVGYDINSGTERLNFGSIDLSNGIPFTILATTLFGLSEIIYVMAKDKKTKETFVIPILKSFIPSYYEFKTSFVSIIRGSFLGTVLGLIPGAGPILSSIASYSLEKKLNEKDMI